MKLAKSILLGSAVGLIGVAGAQAADLPSRKSAPVQYVRICDAYGAGFFYIPGTDTCLKIGGLVVAEGRAFNPSFSGTFSSANGQAKVLPGAVPGPAQALSGQFFVSQREKDAYGFGALGRIELDARTNTAWGTLRTFIRADAYYGSSTLAATGSFSSNISQSTLVNTYANTNTIPRFSVLPSKVFIQFGGLTAGFAQSMFDFYADAYNFEGLRGSNATSALFAYTATFGNGFSGSISAEDGASRRGPIGNTIAGAGAGAAFNPALNGIGAVSATPAGGRIPELIANLRYDQPWGAVQLSGAAHQLNTSIYPAAATNFISVSAAPGGLVQNAPGALAFPQKTSDSYGFAAQLGVQYNLDMIAPGDKLWLQATYEIGAVSYIEGSNQTFINGAPSGNRFPGANNNFPVGYTTGLNSHYDCVWASAQGTCERQQGFAVVAALKHYWIPTVSSSVYGSYMQEVYSNAAQIGAGGGVGASNYKEARLGTNLIWTPVKGFDIGGEFMYFREINYGPAISQNQFNKAAFNNTQANPLGAAPPAFRATQNVYEGRIRVQRAF